jgi:preprotein translocase subunit SecA
MDELRNSVQNASYENKDPLLIYKLESYELFRQMVEDMNKRSAKILMRARIPLSDAQEQVREAAPEHKTDMSKYRTQKDEIATQQEAQRRAGESASAAQAPKQQPVHVENKIGRNEPCPCGSGKKYKNCHGKMA